MFDPSNNHSTTGQATSFISAAKSVLLSDEELFFVLTAQEILAGKMTSPEEFAFEDASLRLFANFLVHAWENGGVPKFWDQYHALASSCPFLLDWKPLIDPALFAEEEDAASTDSEPMLADQAPGVLLSQVRPERVRWLWEPIFPLGMLTLLDGDPGTGKSLLLCDIAARVTRGWQMPDGTAGMRAGVVVIAPEDWISHTIQPRLARAGANLSRVVCLNEIQERESGGTIVSERPFLLTQDLAHLEAAIVRVQAKLVILDPVTDLLGRKEIGKEAEVRVLLAPLKRLMAKMQVACVMVRHLTRKGSENPLYRGIGSIAFIALARSALLAAHDPQDQTRQVLVHCKNNLGPLAQSLAYRISDDKDKGDTRPYILWEGPSPITAMHLGSSKAATEMRTGRKMILALLEEHGMDGLSPQQIAEKLPGMGMSNIRMSLKRLVESGQICQPQRGVYRTHTA